MANKKRLIDANALIAQAEEEMFAYEAEQFAAMISWCPTVDAVEVVHAEWLDGSAIHNGKEVYKSIDCSHCEEVFKIESETREYWKARFKVCPFCGAIMDGGE